ncbi:VirB4 family type IV secretion system protein [Aestuariispira insulae]|uniref:Type IV secretory pathway VirB4 component n=1 Tax=Aestuariispira insulae TaxID=1461337 RepID=A0A3D9H3R1_9PROT|nr:VirB4 family type IV secretion system protein [Aestuariispira insulae]RED44119.1 type IV secretory pathway VirB4 component [Aestuariispira insulae]
MDPNTLNMMYWAGPPIAGSLAIGATYLLNWRPDSRRHVKHDSLPHYLPFRKVLGDSRTVQNADGSLFVVLKMHGTSYSSMDENRVEAIRTLRYEWMKSLSEKDVFVRFFSPHDSVSVPVSTLGDGIIGDLNEKWARHISHSFFTSHYIIISTAKSSNQDSLQSAVDEAIVRLAEHRPEILTNDPDASGFSPLNSFIFYLANGYQETVAPEYGDKLNTLVKSDIWPYDDGMIKLDHPTGREYISVLSFTEFGSNLDYEFVLDLFSQKIRFDFLILSEFRSAKETKKRVEASLNLVKDSGVTDVAEEDWKQEIKQVERGENTDVYTTIAVFVKGDTPEEVKRSAANINEIFVRNHHFLVKESPDCSWIVHNSRVPGFDYKVRQRFLNISQLSELTPMSTVESGNTASPWGPYPIRYLPTVAGGAYAHTMQPTAGLDSPPHANVFAPTRSGKTVLLLFLLTGALSVHPELRAMIFDRNQGARIWTDYIGGQYLWPGRDMPLNFFDNEGTDQDRQLAIQMMRLMANSQGPEVDRWISDFVKRAYEYDDRQGRNMINLFSFMDPALKPLMTSYATANGVYAGTYNGAYDAFDPTMARVNTMAMDTVIDDKELAANLNYYFTRRVQNAYVSQNIPYALIFDEAAVLLGEKNTSDLALSEFRTAGRNRGSVTTIWTTVQDCLDTPNGKKFIMNAGTNYFWPRSANDPEQLSVFSNLTDSHKKFILGEWRPKGAIRPVLMHRESHSVILETDLKPLEHYLHVFAGGADEYAEFTKCKEEFPHDYRIKFLLQHS